MFGVLADSLSRALGLILSFDPELVAIILLSLGVSGAATLVATAWGVPISLAIGLRRFPGRGAIKGLFSVLIGMPTVALATILFLALSRTGPLGSLGILYTPLAIVVGEAILITPILISFTTGSLEAVDRQVVNLAMTLGATRTRAELAVLREARTGVALAITASFGRAIAELGVALMIGGNIPGSTRVLTTAIAVGIGRGDLELGIALAFILIGLVAIVNWTVNRLSRAG